MKNEKAYQKNCLTMEFGILIQPFEELAQKSVRPSINDYRVAIAKVQAGDSKWRNRVRQFTTFAPDVSFREEEREISHVPERFWGNIGAMIRNPTLNTNLDELHCNFTQLLEEMKSKFIELVDSIPVDWQPEIFEANTPFTTYSCILDCIAGARQLLHYFDRYLKEDFFHLYLRNLDRSISIRLVTTLGDNNYGVRHVTCVSNLARQEFTDYQLIKVEPRDLHDRNLRLDSQIFTLGPGTDQAGMKLTNFGPADSSPEAHQSLDNL